MTTDSNSSTNDAAAVAKASLDPIFSLNGEVENQKLDLGMMLVNLDYQIIQTVVFSQRFHEQRRAGDDNAIVTALRCKYELQSKTLSLAQQAKLYQQALAALSGVRQSKGGGVLPQG